MTAPANTLLKPPHKPSTIPFFGCTFEMQKNVVKVMYEGMKEYGDIYMLPLVYPLKMCIMTHPDMAQHVLVTNNRNYIKSIEYGPIKRVLGNGILVSEGDFWRRQRRLAQPAFHRRRLEKLVHLMVENAQIQANKWENANGEIIDIHEPMMALTMGIATEALFNVKGGYNAEVISDAMTAGNRFMNYLISHPFPFADKMPVKKVRHYNRSFKNMDRLIYQIIADRQQNPGQHDDLLAMLMEARDEETGEGMSQQQLRDEALTIFAAGHETTAVALSWLWYLLCLHPEVEQKLHNELDTVLGGRTPTLADLRQLEYTTMVINETMRLYPPAWVIGRQALEDDEVMGYHIPKGTNVEVFTYGIHRSPKLWDNPDQFIPERFTKEASAKRHKYAYHPFGGGPRLCIGNNFAMMEMQLAIAIIAQQYRFELVKDHPVEIEPLVTLRPRYGVKVKVRKRG